MARKSRKPAWSLAVVGATRPSLTTRYGMLCLVAACQLATLLISWPVWQVREQPVNIPLFPLPAVSFGIPLLASLAASLWWPRAGAIAHAAVYGVACLFDQYRVQPQVVSLIVLLMACADDQGAWFVRWYLAALWIWAGLHKFLSPEWLGEQSWLFLHQCGLDADTWHVWFGLGAAVAELALGMTAALAPRRAAVGCLVMHLVILLALSPLVRNFNPSVWPWNLATAVAGWWLLRQDWPTPTSWVRYAIPTSLMLLPAGYYADLVNPHLAFVLYSGNMPYALHIKPDAKQRLDGWGKLSVPFPDSPWLFREVFRRTASPGDKLHIDDPRFGLADRYFLMLPDQTIREITRERFLLPGAERGEVAGSELEDRIAVWQIARSGVALERGEGQLVHSATVQGPQATDAVLVKLAALSNLEALRIEDAAISDRALAVLDRLARLKLLEIRRAKLSDAALPHVARRPELRWLRLEDVPITSDGLASLAALRDLETLFLPHTQVDDRGLVHIGRLDKLEWLDLSDTPVTSAGLAHLTQLPECRWINLSGTRIDDEGLRHLARLPTLEIIELARTQVGDNGLASLRDLPRLAELDLEETSITDAGVAELASLTQLRYLNLRGTRVTEEAAVALETSLPDCRVER